jgi:hypothetical protein
VTLVFTTHAATMTTHHAAVTAMHAHRVKNGFLLG